LVKCKKGPVALTSPIKVAFIYLFIYLFNLMKGRRLGP